MSRIFSELRNGTPLLSQVRGEFLLRYPFAIIELTPGPVYLVPLSLDTTCDI